MTAQTTAQRKQANRLLFLGFVLFTLGLIVGLCIQTLPNPRMGLAAHLEALMNGMFLMLLGLTWNRLVLSSMVLNITYLLVLYGTFANLTANMLAAVTGAGKLLPIAGGKAGTAIEEGLISFLLISLGLCMIAVCLSVLTGLYRHLKQDPAP